MTKARFFLPLIAAAAIVSPVCSRSVFAQQQQKKQPQFEVVTGKAFDSALPKDFYLEGNAIPTAKLNAALVHLPSGARAVFSLIDTSGYAANIVAKYIGMIITEGDLTVCGHKLTVGSYGFGWAQPATGSNEPGKFSLYDQAGKPLTECATSRDASLKQPRPLQVVVKQDGTARLYHGRHEVELR